jgi:hypothetical protein
MGRVNWTRAESGTLAEAIKCDQRGLDANSALKNNLFINELANN